MAIGNIAAQEIDSYFDRYQSKRIECELLETKLFEEQAKTAALEAELAELRAHVMRIGA